LVAPPISPERLIRASLIKMLLSAPFERQLMEQMQYNMLFRWFEPEKAAGHTRHASKLPER